MTDRLEKLERELAAMRPAALPKDLERRIGREIGAERNTNWADRRLLSAMTLGAMAACVILTVLVRGGAMSTPTAPEPLMVRATPTSASYPLLMARADGSSLDELK